MVAILWNYSPDFSPLFGGELEAKTKYDMDRNWYTCYGKCIFECLSIDWRILLPESGTSSADALIWGQHSSGGWPYMLDFSGETSLKHGIPKYRKDIFIVLRNMLIIMEIVLMMMRLPTIVECSFCVCIY